MMNRKIYTEQTNGKRVNLSHEDVQSLLFGSKKIMTLEDTQNVINEASENTKGKDKEVNTKMVKAIRKCMKAAKKSGKKLSACKEMCKNMGFDMKDINEVCTKSNWESC